MRQFLVFVQKEFYHIFRDRWTTLILLVLPIVMIILFGFGITTEIRNTKFAVYDPSRDIATQGIVNKLETSEYFSLDRYVTSPDEIEPLFRDGEIGFVVVLGENFYENLLHTGNAKIQLIADGTDPNTASTLTSYATILLSSYQQELTGTAGGAIPYQIKTEVRLLYNPSLKSAYNIVPGIMGMILMLICALMTSVSIAREKELGTMELLLVSPMKPILVILSKLVPYLTISIINYITILLLSVFVLKVPIAGKPGFAFGTIASVYICLAFHRHSHIFAGGEADSCSSHFGDDTHDACGFPVGADVSYREYAGCFAVDLAYFAG